ncbi:hypothetical protein [Modestobacter excelsi]|uniref:hypothetical protein n=1 Tax=Modestobacter excelsi TaxID=2213161 RepID=UPI00110CD03A|nr:hypothetical protein [Modestobacter excelsi]
MSDVATILPAYIGVALLLIGGAWAYFTFLHQRQGEPATDIDVDLEFIGTQAEQHIIQVTADLENRSLVRHRYQDFILTIRYLTREDGVVDGDAPLNYQLNCPRTIDSRIGGEKRYFANPSYINPRQRFRHRYVTYLPHDATFAWVQCRFTYDHTGLWSRWARAHHRDSVVTNSQRIRRVPQCGDPCRCDRGVVL